MDIIGQSVRHKDFGSGVVTAQNAGTVTVSFPEGGKKFLYPAAFRDFLALEDHAAQHYVTGVLAEREAQARQRQRREQAERERALRLQNFTVQPNSHAVFNIAPADAQRVCESFTLSTGLYLSGAVRGQARIAQRVKPNSACLLTLCPPRSPERERQILGACMVRSDFFGADDREGVIPAHPEYRLLVPAGKTMLLGDYLSRNPAERWGGIPFKYCVAPVMNHILCDLVNLTAGTDYDHPALAFYRYFCRMNQLPPLMELPALS